MEGTGERVGDGISGSAHESSYSIVFIPLVYRGARREILMRFEYDPEKSAQNKRKHGIYFEEAQSLWADPALVEIPARISDEARWLLIGKIDERHWSAIVTRRDENIRLISVRCSREEEVTIYESEDI